MEDNKNNNNEFKDSLKATSLFGGVQIYKILIQIIRSKFIAVLLGPTGIGISNLLSSTTLTLSEITSIGIARSAVKNISEAKASNDEDRLLKVVSVFRRLVWVTGLLGAFVCAFFSPFLSQLAFGNKDYTIAFIILSVTLLFDQLTSGQNTVMQGLHKYRYMSKSAVIGSTIGVIIALPLYYVWGVDAIVPVLLISSITSLLLSLFFYRKINLRPIPVSRPVMMTDGKNMIIMGLSLSLTTIVNTALGYLIKIFIERNGGVEDVGLFAAGFAMVNTYVGLIMNAMYTDYYPRLCGVNSDLHKMSTTINNQMQLSFMLLAPLISVFIVFSHIIVIVLYSDKFIPVEGMMYWAMFATYFQLFSWALSLTFIAKADFKTLVFTEFSSNLYVIPSQLIGYKLAGLTGVGLAYLFNYIIYSLQCYVTCKRRYGIAVFKESFVVYIKQIPVIVCCLLVTIFLNNVYKYTIGTLLVIISFAISYTELNKRIDVKSTIRGLMTKIKNK